MTIETLEKRISGKQATIDKLNAKIERIEKAKATNWEKNPYYYSEHDLEVTLRELGREQDALESYKKQLQEEIDKANSRNVEPLLRFLEDWKARTIQWFKEEKERYEVAKADYYAASNILTDRWNSRRRLGLSQDEIKELDQEMQKIRIKFQSDWNHVTQFFHGSLSWEETLERDMEIEKNRKYDDIINRTVKITGTITDASNLRVGAKGDLNGFIIGEKGKAKVETIGAGGWNIQRWHLRTLVHELK